MSQTNCWCSLPVSTVSSEWHRLSVRAPALTGWSVVGLQCSGSTGWGYVGEISSQRLRAHTAGFGAALSCVMGVIMNVLVPYMLNTNEWNWGLKTAFFYLGVGGPFAVGSWFIIPETKG